MAIRVFDFRTAGKLSTNRYSGCVMSNVTFIMLVSKDHDFKEFTVSIPKRYHFITLTQPNDYTVNKAKEYDVLRDFLVDNEEMLRNKWQLNEEEYKELLEELKICLLREYSKIPGVIRELLLTPVYIKRFVRRMIGRLRIC